jgi:hypothetical protein
VTTSRSSQDRTYTSGRTSLSAMILIKVLDAELEQCLERDLGQGGRRSGSCNLDWGKMRVVGRVVVYKRGRCKGSTAAAAAPPPRWRLRRLPCSTQRIACRTKDDFCICTTSMMIVCMLLGWDTLAADVETGVASCPAEVQYMHDERCLLERC